MTATPIHEAVSVETAIHPKREAEEGLAMILGEACKPGPMPAVRAERRRGTA